MTQLEDQLTDLLTRNAAAVEVRPDLQRVLDATAVVSLNGTPEPRYRRGRPVLAFAAAAVIVVVIGAAMLHDGDSTTTTGPATSPLTSQPSTESSLPRFLVTAEGWSVDRVQERSGDYGEMSFIDGAGQTLDLNWYPADEAQGFVADRQRGSQASWPAKVAGHDVTVFQAAGRLDFSALWTDESHFMELRGSTFASLEEYLAAIAHVQEVDAKSWRSALPPDLVLPEERDAVVAEVLQDMLVPASFNPAQLAADTVNPRYNIEDEVTQAVACAWVQAWIDGTAAGDASVVSAAADAMAGSHDWPVLVANDADFAYYIWQVADAMATGSPINGDTSIPVGVGYQHAIGCPER